MDCLSHLVNSTRIGLTLSLSLILVGLFLPGLAYMDPHSDLSSFPRLYVQSIVFSNFDNSTPIFHYTKIWLILLDTLPSVGSTWNQYSIFSKLIHLSFGMHSLFFPTL